MLVRTRILEVAPPVPPSAGPAGPREFWDSQSIKPQLEELKRRHLTPERTKMFKRMATAAGLGAAPRTPYRDEKILSEANPAHFDHGGLEVWWHPELTGTKTVHDGRRVIVSMWQSSMWRQEELQALRDRAPAQYISISPIAEQWVRQPNGSIIKVTENGEPMREHKHGTWGAYGCSQCCAELWPQTSASHRDSDG
jgi:hypothetical protein